MSILLKINSATKTIESHSIERGQGRQGKVEHIHAKSHVKYELVDENGLAPKHIITKRVGKDLHLVVDQGDINQPDVIIENYYDERSAIVGRTENGLYHDYIPESGNVQDGFTHLIDHKVALQVIDNDAAVSAFYTETSLLGLSNTALGAIGLLGLGVIGGGIAAAAGGGSSGSPDKKPAANEVNSLTTHVPAVSAANVTAVRLSGDSVGLKPTTLVTLTIKDDSGNTVTATATIKSNGTYSTAADLSALTDGPITITATAIDSNGIALTAHDSAVQDALVGRLTTLVPNVTAANVKAVPIRGTSTGVDPGAHVTLTLKDDNGHSVTVTATVNAAGRYSTAADLSALTDGPITITATATDSNSVALTAHDSALQDALVGRLTTLVPDVTAANVKAVPIRGTSTGVDPGAHVTLTLKDDNGHTVTATATIKSNGTYSTAADLSALTDGSITITATATDSNGVALTAHDSALQDALVGQLTTLVPDVKAANVKAVPITGTSTGVDPGAHVTLTLKDDNGHTVTATATIKSNGTYSTAADLSALTDGSITITATATDSNGVALTAHDSALQDALVGQLTTLVPDVTAANVKAVPISGTSTDIAVGSTVNLRITDANGHSVTATAIVNATGAYSTTVNLTRLSNGAITVTAQAIDHNGFGLTATDGALQDTIIATLSATAPDITAANITAVPITGTSVGIAAGSAVMLTISDDRGHTVTATTTINTDGSFSIATDLTSLSNGTITIVATATDYTGAAVIATDTSHQNAQAAGLTLVIPDVGVDNVSAVAITGTSAGLVAGSVVTLTISDANGHIVTALATVDADGRYHTTVDLTHLNDGPITIIATATDKYGNPITTTDTAIQDAVISALTTVVPDVTAANITAVPIHGTGVDIAPGTLITISISDSHGHSVTATATINSDGTYSTKADLTSLSDGLITILATATDSNGTVIDGTDTSNQQANASGLTLIAPDITATNVAAVAINGRSSGLASGTEVIVTITDDNGNTVSKTTTVNGDGTYRIIANLISLTDGPITITATAIDHNGITVTASDTGHQDALVGGLTVSIPEVTPQNVATVPLAGKTVGVDPGTTVTLTISDDSGHSVTVTASVLADGTYSNTANLTGLTDGPITIEATALDSNGVVLTDTDTGNQDALVGSITTTAPTVTAANVSAAILSGSTLGVDPGSIVTLTIKDDNGHILINTTTVLANGSYSTSADLTGLTDGPITVMASATDSNGLLVIGHDAAIRDALVGNLTVTVPDVTAATVSAVPINGKAVGVDPGTVITVTASDDSGNTLTTTATVLADGSYAVTANLSGLTDGPITVAASMLDSNGMPLTANAGATQDALNGTLTMTVPEVTPQNVALVPITGKTEGVDPGTLITITVFDHLGYTVTLTAVVQADGTYSTITDLSALSDGALSVVGTASDSNGVLLSALATSEQNVIPGNLTVSVPDVSAATVAAVPVTGNAIGFDVGAVISITATDDSGNRVSTTASVLADGTYSTTMALSSLTDGPLTIRVTGVDSNNVPLVGAVSSVQDLLVGSLTAVVPNVTAGNVSAVPVTGITVGVDPGTVVTINITDGLTTITTTATVLANGTYSTSADLSTLTDGTITISATATDSNGVTLIGTDTSVQDALVGRLVASIPDVTADNVSAVPITGTTVGVDPGSLVTVTISDDAGHSVTATATVNANGTYSTSADLSTLTDGTIIVTGTVIDSNGLALSGNATRVQDALTGSLSTVAPDVNAANVHAVPLAGTTVGVEPGTVITLTIKDGSANTITVLATVQANGTYSSSADLSMLTDGAITITASAIDSNGLALTATDSSVQDALVGSITTIAPNVAAGNVVAAPLSGTTIGVEPGATVTLIITDHLGQRVTTTATVMADGSYSAHANLAALADGALSITATVTDSNGVSVSGTDSGLQDAVSGEVTAIAPNVSAANVTAVPISGRVTDIDAGSTITLTIQDDSGRVVTATTLVLANGSYSTTVNLSSLTDGPIMVSAAATDRSNAVVTGSVNSTQDALVGAITTLLPDVTASNVAAVPINGQTFGVDPGTVMTVTVTDDSGNAITTTALVDANGHYATTLNLSMLTDGAITATVTASDSNGVALTGSDTRVQDVLIGSLTTVVPDVTAGNVTAVPIAGTTVGVDPGTVITVSMNDGSGNTVTTTATVQANGTYSATVNLTTLTDGSISTTVTATDSNGVAITGAGTSVQDALVGSITALAPAVTAANVASVPISGATVGVDPGTVVTVIISDDAGNAITVTATVNSDGTYNTSANLSSLTDGPITITATATDSNGLPLSITSGTTQEALTGSLTTVMSDVTSGNVIAVPIAGKTVGVDPGTVVTVTISDDAGNAIIVTTTVNVDGTYNIPANLSGLTDGPITITATATDSNGVALTGSDVSIQDVLTGSLTTVVPDVTAGNVATVPIVGRTVGIDPGTIITVSVSDGSGNTVTATATVLVNGTYSTTTNLSTLTDGTITATVMATDSNGLLVIGHDAAIQDALIGNLTLTVPDVTAATVSAVPINGKAVGVDPGTVITVTASDDSGNTLTTTATVLADGSYAVTANLSGLTDGPITVAASMLDSNGMPLTANAGATQDALNGTLTMTVPEVTPQNVALVPITGKTEGVDPGTLIAITVSDHLGHTVTLTAVVQADGTYSATTDLSALSDGALSVVGTASDSNGVLLSALATSEQNVIPGNLTVSVPDVSAATVAAVPVTGNAIGFDVGAVISITATDDSGNRVSTTASVLADGTYSTTMALSSLTDGPITITASAIDSNGVVLTGSDVSIQDALTGSLTTVMPDVTSGNVTAVPITGTTVGVDPGTVITVNVTDDSGNTVTATAIVQADGTYSTTANLSTLTDGTITGTVTATDSNGVPLTSTATSNQDALVGSITASAPAVTAANVASVPISGTTVGVDPGTVVTVTISDDVGNAVTVTTTVNGDGSYNTPANLSGLTDGPITIIATATDSNGVPLTDTSGTTQDALVGSLTTVAPDVTALNVMVVPIAGTAVGVDPGTMITVVVSDDSGNSVTVTAVVNTDGTYAATADLIILTDGPITITATATDSNGVALTGSDVRIQDALIGSLTTVVPDVNSGNVTAVPIAGTTVGVDAGTVITVNVNDGSGNTVTATAIVQADGSYSTTANLTTLTDGNISTTASAIDSNGVPLTGTDTSVQDALVGSITASAPAVTAANVASVPVSGTTVGVDPGTIVTVTISDDAGNAVTVTATVNSDGTYNTPANLTALTDGPITITATATDSNGMPLTNTSGTTQDALTGSLTTMAPDVTALNVAAVPISGSSVGVDPGTVITVIVSDDSGNSVSVTAVVNTDGTYTTTADLSPLTDGPITITATATDSNGVAIAGSDVSIQDALTGSLTTVVPDVTAGNVTAVPITGTTVGVDPGTVITVNVTDDSGNTVTATATVQADGTYSTTANLSTLTDGTITATVTATDSNGVPLTSTATSNQDALVGSITASAPAVTAANVASVPISGTTVGVDPGTIVTVTISDDAGNAVTVTATVNSDGTYNTPANLTALTDGPITIAATATDSNGVSLTNTSGTTQDALMGSLTTMAPDITALNVMAVPITGATVGVDPGTVITVIVSDDSGNSVSVTAVVNTDGTYTTTADLSPLTDGPITITATATDSNGVAIAGSDVSIQDALTGSLTTVVPDVTAGNVTAVPITGTTVGVDPGTVITVNVTDDSGNTVTATATVQADGTYSTTANLSTLTDGTITATVTATDSNGVPLTGTDNSNQDALVGSISASAPAVTAANVASVPVSGTTVGVDPGTIVTVTISDDAGNAVTVTATVNSDGTYNTPANLTALTDGPITIAATATDSNGVSLTNTSGTTQDALMGSLTTMAPDITALNVMAVPITGATVGVDPGTVITVIVSDDSGNSVSVTAVVNTDGTYTTTADLSPLTDGPITITATATDSNGVAIAGSDVSIQDALTGSLTTVVPDVTAGNVTAVPITGTTVGVDPGTVITVNVTDDSGNTVTATATVQADGTYSTTANLSTLTDGTITATVTATDSNGVPLTGTDNSNQDALVGSISASAPAVTAANVASVPVSGTTVGVDPGTIVTVTISDDAGNAVTVTATVNSDGTYNTPANLTALTDGPITIAATATDSNGVSLTNTSGTTQDALTGSLTTVAPDVTALNVAAVPISGSSVGVDPGTVITVIVSDDSGNSVSVTAVVNTDGTYTTTADLSPLTDGPITITASVIDSNGVALTGSDVSIQDALTGSLTTVMPDVTSSNVTAVPITGTTVGVDPGTVITVNVTDDSGNTVTATATVQADGTYSTTANLSTLTDGTITGTVTATDSNGVPLTGTATSNQDALVGSITALAPAVTAANVASVPISGTTVGVDPGAVVTVTISDDVGNAVTITATVNSDGSYNTPANLSSLTDGPITITATATDSNGMPLINTSGTTQDALTGSLTTVAPDVTALNVMAVPISGSSVGVDPGTIITVIVSDDSGNSVTVTAVVNTDGTYTTTVDLHTLTDGPITITASVIDSNGVALAGSDTRMQDALIGNVTTVMPDVTAGNVTAIPITGTTVGVDPGTVITVSVNDDSGNTITATATVQTDGSYSTTANLTTLTDGSITASASASDSNGVPLTGTDNGNQDALVGSIAASAPAVTAANVASVPISGTTVGVDPGAIVTVTISDDVGNAVTVTTTVNGDGTYNTPANLSGLTDGPITIIATATDSNGVPLINTSGTIQDALMGSLTTIVPDVTAGNVTAVPISGSSVGVDAGTMITVIVSDDSGNNVTVTATVNSDGTYTTTADLSALTDGPININATATDSNGVALAGSDTRMQDALIGNVTTVMPDVTAGNVTAVPITGTTVGVDPGTVITVNVTDDSGNTVTATAIVQADGTYSTTANLTMLTDGSITASASATDSNGVPLTGTATSNQDALVGSITALAPAVTAANVASVPISGTTVGVDPGAVVTVTISDDVGNAVTITATVNSDGSYNTPANLSSLTDGPITITATATDSNGMPLINTSGTTQDALTGSLTTVAPDVTALNVMAVPISGSSVGVDPGTIITVIVSDDSGNSVTVTAVVNTDGTYTTTVDLHTLTDGPITITASVIDSNGVALAGSDTRMQDALIGNVTTVMPDVTAGNVTAIPITGTTVGVDPGTVITVSVNDDSGNTITATATVQTDGSYSTTANLTTLTDGSITASASASDSNGVPLTGTDNGNQDALVGSIAASAPAVTAANVASVPISGTTVGVDPGAIVTVTISDDVGNAVTVTTTVNGDGTYNTPANLTALTDGPITIAATATDSNGVSLTNTSGTTQDALMGSLTTIAPDVTALNVMAVPITGATVGVDPGTVITVIVSDDSGNSVSVTAVVNTDGTYAATADLITLTDGPITITATATDSNGVALTGNDVRIQDALIGSLTTVVPDVNSGNVTAVPIAGTTVGVDAGTVITVNVNDGSGNTVTATAIVQADGTYSTTANLTTLTDGSITASASATDSNGVPLTATDTSNQDALVGSIAASAPAVTAANVASVPISGTTVGVDPGAIVTVTISDDSGNTVTVTATVNGDGTYNTPANLSSLTDGPITITATATDSNGMPLINTSGTTQDALTGSLTTMAPDITALNVMVVPIAGTTVGVDPGTVITVVVSDDNSNSVTVTAAVNTDGTYTTIADLSTLTDGPITITATATDSNGVVLTGSDVSTQDALTGSLTTVVPDVNSGNVTAVPIAGTTVGVDAGTVITVSITDGSGNTVTATSIVQADGTYSTTANLTTLTDGSIIASASATDSNGVPLTGTDTSNQDALMGSIVASVPAVTAANVASVPVSGTTVGVDPGTVVTVTISDDVGNAVTVTTTVNGDGSYNTPANLSGLTDGPITIIATATDSNGVPLTNTSGTTQDALTGSLTTVAPDVTAGNVAAVPIAGTAVGVDPGTVITVIVSDDSGNSVSVTATVNTDGTYTTTADLHTLTDGSITITATATDSNGVVLTGSDVSTQDALTGSLTTVVPDVTAGNVTTVPIAGTTVGVDPGSVVSITLNDGAGGHTATATATVLANGTYSTTTNITGFIAGTFNVSASTTDSNGVGVTGIDASLYTPNQAPVVSAAVTATGTEDGAGIAVNLLQNASDPDADILSATGITYKVDGVATATGGTTLPAGASLAGNTLTIDPTNAAYQNLALGATKAIVASYTISDGHGGTVAQTATTTIAGVNDAPILSSSTMTSSVALYPSVGYTEMAQNSAPQTIGTTTITATGTVYTDQLNRSFWVASAGSGNVSGSITFHFSSPIYTFKVGLGGVQSLGHTGIDAGTEEISFMVDGSTILPQSSALVVNSDPILNTSSLLLISGTYLIASNTYTGTNAGGMYTYTSATPFSSFTVNATILSGITFGVDVNGYIQTNTGITVGSLIPGATDADTGSSIHGYAVTSAAASGSSHWEYYNGSTWVALTAASTTSAIFLTPSTLVRWNGANNDNHTALSALAVDNTSTAILGNTINVTTTGGITAYSGQTAILLATPTETATLSAMSKDSAYGSANTANFITTDANKDRGYTGTLSSALLPGESLQVSTDGGSTWSTANVTGTNWQYTSTTTGDYASNWTVQTRVTNTQNMFGPVTSQTVTLETAAVAPVITAVKSGASTIANGAASTVVTEIDGTGVAGDTVVVYDNTIGNMVGTTTVLANGSWVLPYSATLSTGVHNYYAVQIDNKASLISSLSNGYVVDSNLITNGELSAGNTGFSTVNLPYSATIDRYGNNYTVGPVSTLVSPYATSGAAVLPLITTSGSYTKGSYTNASATAPGAAGLSQTFETLASGNVINASLLGASTVWQTNVSVVAGQTYQFSFDYFAWSFSNVGLAVNIDGVAINLVPVYALATGVFTATYVASTTKSMTLSITGNNTSAGGSGGDCFLDNLSFGLPSTTPANTFIAGGSLAAVTGATATADTLTFSASNTYIDGLGGNDVINVPTNIQSLLTSGGHIDGGSGLNTLSLTGGTVLNLSALAGAGSLSMYPLEHMQVINMSNSSGTDGSDADSLTLNTDTVLHLGNAGLFTGAGTTPSFIQMEIKGEVGDSVTLQKLVGSTGNEGVWVNTGTWTDASSVVYNVWDNTTTKTEVLIQQGVTTGLNTPPTATPITTSAAEDSAVATINLLQSAADLDSDPLTVSPITYTIDGVATGSGGTALPAGASLVGNTLTIDPTDAAYQSLAAGATKAIVASYTISDGNGGTVAQTASASIIGVNDAPVLGGTVMNFNASALPVGGVTPAGAAISSMMPTITDVDTGSSVKGYAITGALANGANNWQYKNGAGVWTNLTAATAASPIFLTPATLVRWNGTTDNHTAFSAIAVDNTSAAALGNTLTVSSTGGTTPYSSTTATLVATPTQTTTITAMSMDSGLTAASVANFTTTDLSAGRAVTGTLSSALLTNQEVQASFDGGATWTDAVTNGTNWVAIDPGTHASNWTIKSHVVVTANSSLAGAVATQNVTVGTDLAAPVITGINTKAGIHTLQPATTGAGVSITEIEGTAAVGSKVSVYDSDTSSFLGTANTNASGVWTLYLGSAINIASDHKTQFFAYQQTAAANPNPDISDWSDPYAMANWETLVGYDQGYATTTNTNAIGSPIYGPQSGAPISAYSNSPDHSALSILANIHAADLRNMVGAKEYICVFATGVSSATFHTYSIQHDGNVDAYDINGNLIASSPYVHNPVNGYTWDDYSVTAPAGQEIAYVKFNGIWPEPATSINYDGWGMDTVTTTPFAGATANDVYHAIVSGESATPTKTVTIGLTPFTSGNDTIAIDAVNSYHETGLAGDDIFTIDTIANLSTFLSHPGIVDGGAGMNTLSITSDNQTLNLTTLGLTALSAGTLRNIDSIDITGGATASAATANTLHIDVANVFDLGSIGDLFGTGNASVPQMMVTGDNTDKITVSHNLTTNTAIKGGSWIDSASSVVNDGHTYEVYNYTENATTLAQLLVDTRMTAAAVFP